MISPDNCEPWQVVRKVPKAELHIHLEGAANPRLILALAKKCGISLPVFHSLETTDIFRCKNLSHLWDLFNICRPLWTNPQNLFEVIKSLIEGYVLSNTIYFELRFNIAGPVQRGLPYDEGMCAIQEALDWGKTSHGIESCLILGFNRNTPETVPWLVEKVIEEYDKGRCHGIDINGDESGCYSTKYLPFFETLASKGIPILAHAGESSGEDSILDCLSIPGIKRLGHMVQGGKLTDLILKANVGLEMCITSNLKTKVLQKIEKHPLSKYRERGISISLNSDNPLMFNTDIEKEYFLAFKHFDLTLKDLTEITADAIRSGLICEDIKMKLLQHIGL